MKGNGQEYDLLDEGFIHAKCYAVVDLGTQNVEWQGTAKKKREVVFLWELVDYFVEIEKDGVVQELPRVISRRFTLSLHKKSLLRPFLVSWRGANFTPEQEKAFDVKTVLSAPCTLQIIHNQGKGDYSDKTYANVANAIPLMDKTVKQELVNPPIHFSFEEEMEIPETLPDWIKEKIKQSDEWRMSDANPEVMDVNHKSPLPDDDEIPF